MAGSMDLKNRAERLGKAAAELTDIAATIDWLYDCSDPSMELIEATRAVHGALSVLGTLSASLSDALTAQPPGRAMSSGNGDVSRRTETRSSASASVPISILYDDLLEPIRASSDGEKTPPTSAAEARSE